MTPTFTSPSTLGTNGVYLDNWNTGDSIDVTVSVEAGDYDFSILYNAGSFNGAREIQLQTAAASSGTFVTIATWNMGAGDFVDTGSWGQGPAQASSTKSASLPAGDYSLRYLAQSSAGVQADSFTIVAVPEPATAILGGLGLLGLLRRRRA